MLFDSSRLTLMVAATLSFLHLVVAHSHISYVIVNGLLYQGFDPHNSNNPANSIGWATTVSDDGFVPPSNYSTTDIICHRDGTPAKAHVPIKAGDKMHIQWNGWPQSHHGPVMSYLAPCSGSSDGCASVDKTKLSFSKIDNSAPAFISEAGGPPGSWATDVLIASNNSWMIQIPSTLEPGPYVLRHELVALHYANQPDGAQNYPQCVNLWVMPPSTSAGTGSHLDLGQGTEATKLYKATDPGVDIDIYQDLTTYSIPGPTVVAGAAPIALGKQTKSRVAGGGTPVSVVASKTAPFVSVKATKAARRDRRYPVAVPKRGLV